MHLNWGIFSGAIVGILAQILPVVTSGTFGPKAQAIGNAAALLLGAFGVHQISTNAASASANSGDTGKAASGTGQTT